jgi:hypothetical protein
MIPAINCLYQGSFTETVLDIGIGPLLKQKLDNINMLAEH